MATKATTNAAALSEQRIKELRAGFEADAYNEKMQNAITQTTINDIALRRSVVNSTAHTFSVRLDDWGVTNQKSSGRCWIFAALNSLRVAAMKKMKLGNFEFSQNYVAFWDKLERANWFLENVIRTRKLEDGCREVDFLMSDPIGDGGQWNMFVNVVKKYGVVPKAAMPETQSSSASGAMNRSLVEKLREGAMELRKMAKAGSSLRDLRAKKHEFHSVIYRILCIHLGTPPTSFDWQWQDKKKKFHRDSSMTPKKFAAKYIGKSLDDFVCIVHDPRNRAGKMYTVDMLGNVVDGDQVRYLNVDIGLMKKATMQTLQDGNPVWMGCDVGKQMRGDMGIWDAQLFDFGGVYQTEFPLTKKERLLCGATQMTHAMLFTGVDVVRGKPRRWRVENSWGGDKGKGQKGFYTMNDSWFDEYMFEVAVQKKYLPVKLRKILDTKPTMLPPWDPMGSLA